MPASAAFAWAPILFVAVFFVAVFLYEWWRESPKYLSPYAGKRQTDPVTAKWGWLMQAADSDLNMPTGVVIMEHTLDTSHVQDREPFIEFKLQVFNGSIWPITFAPTVAGNIGCDDYQMQHVGLPGVTEPVIVFPSLGLHADHAKYEWHHHKYTVPHQFARMPKRKSVCPGPAFKGVVANRRNNAGQKCCGERRESL
jgi:hypothetical protein